MEFVEGLGAIVNKCSYINEYINFFLQYRSSPSNLTNKQVYSNDEFDLWPVYSGVRFRASWPSCCENKVPTVSRKLLELGT